MKYTIHYTNEMESLQNILGSRDFTPPTEVEAVKEFIKRRYDAYCKVIVQKDGVVITVKNSALAGTLRLEQQRLKEACGIKQKLIIRIG